MKFHNWLRNPKHRLLFSEGGFKHDRRSRYHSLVKRYNVFVEYHNRMESFEYNRGDMTKIMKVSSEIIELYQKERFDRQKSIILIVIIGVHSIRLLRRILEIVIRHF